MNELNQLIEQITHLNSTGNHKRVVNLLSPAIFKKYNNARLYYEAGLANDLGNIDHGRAIQRYSEAINIDAAFEEAIYNRGKLYVKQGEFTPGAQDFERLILLNPREHKYHESRGEVYMLTGDNEKAVACFTKAIESEAGSVYAWFCRGFAWLELDESEKSIEDETKALLLDPDFMMAYSIKGRAFAKLSSYEKAIGELTKAIKLEPAHLPNYEYRASVWDSSRNHAKAIEDYSKVIRLNAENDRAYFKRGEIYFKMGEYEKALTDFRAANQFEDNEQADAGIVKAITALEKNNTKEQFADKELIRKKAASFLDKIKVAYGNRFRKAKDGFRCGKKTEWDFKLNRPKTADLEGWLPEIMPDIAKWDIITSAHSDNVLVHTLTPIGELFYPHLVGIPIKEELWEAVNEPFSQYKVGERTLGYVQKFEAVGKLLERLIRSISVGDLDEHLILEYYHPEISDEKIYRAYRSFLALQRSPFSAAE